jgi:diguanylate cyclase (GGDEF)-like protein
MTHVLVADDDPTLRLLMQAALEAQGFAVTLAQDGDEALSMFNENRPDMVVLDVEMPGRSGYEVCTEIRRQVGEDIPVVMVTGHDDVESIERAFEVGATDFISKPINWTLIGHRIRYILRGYHTLQSLHRAETHKHAMLQALPDLLLRVDAKGVILETHGHTDMPVDSGAPLGHFQTREQLAALNANAIRLALSTGKTQRADYSLQSAVNPNQVRYYESRVTPVGLDEALCLIRDTTENHEARQRIRQLDYFDALTDLPNMKSFREHLDRELTRAKRENLNLAVLFFDLDGFKDVNDSLGYNKGDELLRLVADRLRTELRLFDIVGLNSSENQPSEDNGHLSRLGGDEFTVLLSHIEQAEDALLVADRIRTLMTRPYVIDGQELVLTSSVGISVFPDDAMDADTLITYADTAMYAAKGKGRDNCHYYSAALTARAFAQLSLKSALHQALDRNEFQLLYQPQVDSRSGVICAVEALIRWNHPERGQISPLEFIPMAEELGLIVSIGSWILRKACEDAMHWQQIGLPAIQMSVNLSVVQFRNPNLLQEIQKILHETRLPANCLELEVTESALMVDAKGALAQMLALRHHGVRIAIDDFGTGYSSLQYLKDLPLSKLKIDRAFVSGLPSVGKTDEAIIRAVIAMSRTLDMQVTAEGVETLEQANLLIAMDCDTLQGFYFSRPVSASAIPGLMRQAWPLAPPTA